MKKYLFLAALGLVTLASCTSDDLVVQGPADNMGEETPIIFSSLSKGMTRTEFHGADAATRLGNKFVVAGKKGSSTDADGTIVFDNYLVEYAENTANTTESNSCNWEYVGKGLIKHATDAGITKQTIKYWDYTKAQYDFIAWSTGSKTAIYSGDPAAGQVLVSAINPNDMDDAVTFTGTAADLKECYISDITTVKKGAAYGQPVTLSFRQLGTKVRIAIYETIPGYSVKNVEFYNAAATGDKSATAKLFTTTANDIYTEGTYTVKYPNVDDPSNADNNQAHVTFAPKSGTDQTTIVDWGALNYTIREDGESSKDKVYLGRSSNTASFAGDADKNYYEIFLPNQTGTNLNLRVNYTLESIDGGKETIDVKGATAQVPSIYTQWKPGFAYTYIFKISDKTNGTTGVYDPTKPDDTTVNSDPTGLYPITFDAVVVNAEDNDKTQETITLVATPSITTYQKGSTVVNNNEYLAATGEIFVTVNDGGGYVEVTGLNVGDDVSSYYTYNTGTGKYSKCGASETAVDGTKYYKLDPVLANGDLVTLTGNAALYTLPTNKTEAEVIDALQMQDDDAAAGTIKGRSGLVLTEAAFTLDNKVEYGVDGNPIAVGTDQALRFTPSAGTYAFVYTKTAPTTTTDMFQAVTKADGAAVNGLYRFALTAAPAGDVQKGVKYFPNEAASADMITAFLGQGVSNLYTRSGAGTTADPYVYTIASGYAVTCTTYYYTTDNGQSYTAATNIAFEEFGTTTLYKDAACTITKTEATPADGQAYYDSTGKYCIILPQQTTGLYVIDKDAAKVACGATTAVKGMTYFDKYIQNNGVYYVKVIKVQ